MRLVGAPVMCSALSGARPGLVREVPAPGRPSGEEEDRPGVDGSRASAGRLFHPARRGAEEWRRDTLDDARERAHAGAKRTDATFTRRPRWRSCVSAGGWILTSSRPKRSARCAGAAATEQDAAICLTAAFTGLRRGELIALRWRDVDFPASRIRVSASYAGGQLTAPKRARSAPSRSPQKSPRSSPNSGSASAGPATTTSSSPASSAATSTAPRCAAATSRRSSAPGCADCASTTCATPLALP
jgi:hypothetical protein